MVDLEERRNKIFCLRGEFFKEDWISLTPLNKEEYVSDPYLEECFRIVYNRDAKREELLALLRNDDLKASIIFRANQKIQRDSME